MSDDTPRRRFPQRRAEGGASDSTRKMASLDARLLATLDEHRERIEHNLPRKRWRSKQEYLDIVLALGLRQLEAIQPVQDSLLNGWQNVEKMTAPGATTD